VIQATGKFSQEHHDERPPSLTVNGESGRRGAAVLLILAWVLWLHPWVLALLVGGFVSSVLLHKRLEGDLGRALVRIWQRAWPPGGPVLIPLLSASLLVFWTSDVPIAPRALPIALSILGLSTILLGVLWTPFGHAQRFWKARREPALAAKRPPGSMGTGERA
jgi:hypothetical protein